MSAASVIGIAVVAVLLAAFAVLAVVCGHVPAARRRRGYDCLMCDDGLLAAPCACVWQCGAYRCEGKGAAR